jgi:hypothetical protein
MAEQVNVCVKNVSGKDINVVRKLADGTTDLEKTIGGGEEDTTLLPEPEVFLVISTPDAPNGYTIQNCGFHVTLNDDVVELSKMDDYHWKVQISDNSRPPEVPTDVNIEIQEEPPVP